MAFCLTARAPQRFLRDPTPLSKPADFTWRRRSLLLASIKTRPLENSLDFLSRQRRAYAPLQYHHKSSGGFRRNTRDTIRQFLVSKPHNFSVGRGCSPRFISHSSPPLFRPLL